MKTAFIIACCLFLVSCNKLKEGTVTDKRYKPRSEYLMMQPIVISDGKNITTTFITYWVVDDEDWIVEIQGEYKGKKRTESVYVTKSRYDCVKNGDHFVLDKDCSLEDNNNTKTER